MKEIGYGADYKYAHSFKGNFVDQEFLPSGISGTTLYEPQDNPKEREIAMRLRNLWKDKYNY